MAGTMREANMSAEQHRWSVGWVIVALATGCGQPGPQVDAGFELDGGQVDAGAEDSGTTDAGETDGGRCPEGSHRVAGGCDSALSWTAAADFPSLREHHMTFIGRADAGTFLWVLGGADTVNHFAFTTPLRAQLQEDGGLGAWQQSSSAKLPKALFGATLAQVGSAVLVVGGTDLVTNAESASTYVSAQLENGTIAPWSPGPDLSQGLMHQCAVVDGDDVYVIGGMYWTGADGKNVAAVSRTHFNGLGFDPWVADTPLPDLRSHHSCAAHRGVIYVTGGMKGDPAGSHATYDDVLAAKIQPDHTLGPWTKVATLATGLSIHSSFVKDEQLYVVGGLASTFVSDVRRARISTDGGTWGSWESMTPLPIPRGHVHQTPIWRQFIYSVGGANSTGSQASVLVGRFE
jgi:hypothetical protein